MIKMKNYINICLFVSLSFLVACHSAAPAESTQIKVAGDELVLTKAQLKNLGLQLGAPTSQMMNESITVTGKVDVPPNNLVAVHFSMGGYLESINLMPGQEVRKGSVIAWMKDPAYIQIQQDFLEAKAKLNYLKKDRARQQTLSKQNAASYKNYELIESEYEAQLALVAGLSAKLTAANINPNSVSASHLQTKVPIYAPVDGYVMDLNVHVGEYVSSSEVLFTLINPDDLHAVMNVYERDLASFSKGMAGKVFMNGDSTQKFPVEVVFITKDVDSNAVGLVHCHFLEKHPKLLPGAFLNGIFNKGTHLANVLPEDAVVRFEGKNYVFIAKNDTTFTMTQVQIGNSENGMVEILPSANKNLSNAHLVVEGAYDLLGALKNSGDDD